MMDINDELIRRFLNDQCDRQEAEQVAKYLTHHPRELEKYIGEEEWARFEAGGKIHPAQDTAIWQAINSRLTARKPVRTMLKPWLAAASIAGLMMIAGSIFFFTHKTHTAGIAALQPSTRKLLTPALARVENTSGCVKAIALQDGSTVYLQPNSSLRYEEPFRANARLLYLEGEAFFKVAKDKTRPFTVEAGGFTTTALGTSFLITVFRQQARVRVQLVTGKVVVKSATPGAGRNWTDVYLLPGHEVNVDTETMVAATREIPHNRDWATYFGSTPSPAPAKANTGDRLDFNNQPLTRIFETLQNHYNVRLKYDHAALHKIFFTGKFNSGENIDTILHLLAELNNLAVSKDGDIYTIKK